MQEEKAYICGSMDNKGRIIEVCDWKTVEDLTRKGTMADKVIEQIGKHMWTLGKGLKQGVFLAFGGGSIVFDSPLPGMLRMNTYCEEEGSETGYGGGEHAKQVMKPEDLEDAVWLLLADAFDDLCDSDQFCTEAELQKAYREGRLEELVKPAFLRYPKDSVFLEVWFGNSVSASWLGEGVIFIGTEMHDDTLSAEGHSSDPEEELAKAVAGVVSDIYERHGGLGPSGEVS